MRPAADQPELDFWLYMDQDSLDEGVIAGLRRAGANVLTSVEAGHQRTPDHEQLEFAATEGRVIYTANRGDFARLHAEWMETGRHHAGIIIRSRQQTGTREQIRGLAALARRFGREDWSDRLEYL